MSTQKPYQVTQYDDLPALRVEIFPGYSAREHLEFIVNEVRQILDAAQEPLHVIQLIDAVPVTLDDTIISANLLARGENAIWEHPNIGEIIWVTTNKMVRLAMKGLDSSVFGNRQQHAFDTLDEAIAFVRENS